MVKAAGNGIDKILAIKSDGTAYDLNLKWLKLTQSLNNLGETEIKAAAIILSETDGDYVRWRALIKERLHVTDGYVSVIMNALRAKSFLTEDNKPNKRLVLPKTRPVNILIRMA